jgi:putative nucleotidyltransferase with HDIG domain
MSTVALDNKVQQIVSNIRNLPTPPLVFHQIQKVSSDPDVPSSRLAKILSEDPAMSVKVLKLTNSAFYGLSREVVSVQQAVTLVGMEAIKSLVLSASVLDMFKSKDLDQEYQERFWRHSLATGLCGRLLAKGLRARGVADPDSAFSAGLLHDIGKLIVCCFLPDGFHSVKEALERDTTSLEYEVEERVLGYSHAQIGGFLAAEWKLPQTLIDAISSHHNPGVAESDRSVAHIIHIADGVAHRTFDLNPRGVRHPINPEVMDFMGVAEADLELYSEALQQEYSKAETFMQMVGLD